MSHFWQGRRVLVTGATGFIGSFLVQRLVAQGASVRALVRDFGKMTRIARFPVEVVQGKLTDADAVEAAVMGCDIVLHCAHDWSDAKANLAIVASLGQACKKHCVTRLVYVSSLAVYAPLKPGPLTEEMIGSDTGWEYQENKLAAEQGFLNWYQNEGVPVSVVQPTMVYGPYSYPFTLFRVDQLRTGRVALPDQGEGLCNLVYVEDVVQSILLAAECKEAVGERFLISAEQPVTWRQLYEAYEKVIGVQRLVYFPLEELTRMIQTTGVSTEVGIAAHDPGRLFREGPLKGLVKKVRNLGGVKLIQKVKKSLPLPLHLPDEPALGLYSCTTSVSIEKAKQKLGYAPQFDFARGMEITSKYVKWANL